MRILHAADLHLDSPFEGLSAGKAALRRGEQRDLLYRLASLAANEKADVVLLAGDLLDSDKAYRETAEDLVRSLSMINVPVRFAVLFMDVNRAKRRVFQWHGPDADGATPCMQDRGCSP